MRPPVQTSALAACGLALALASWLALPGDAVEPVATANPLEQVLRTPEPVAATSLAPRPSLDSYRGLRTRLSGAQLAELLSLAGFTGRGHRLAWLVAMRESHGDPRAHNRSAATGDDSYGLFQVNMIGGLGPDRRRAFGLSSSADLLDPVTNARVAFRMSRGGTDFGAWGLGPNAYRQRGTASLRQFVADYPGDPRARG